MPPMIFEHSKEGLIQSLQNNLTKTYKRKRLKLAANETETTTDNVKDDDMDIEGSDGENSDSPVLFPQPRPGADENSSNTVPDEASLLELERRQEELRRALEEDESSGSNSLPSDQNVQQKKDENKSSKPESDDLKTQSKSNENNTIETDSPESPTPEEPVTNVSITETTNEIIETVQTIENSVLNTPTPTTTGQSRESVFGTPLIKQVSPFTRLPCGDKWSVGVSDVIDFENLPEATGTYQKLTGLIQKVRTVVKRINDDTIDDSS